MYVSDSRELSGATARFKSTWGDLRGEPPEMPFDGVCLIKCVSVATLWHSIVEHSMPFNLCSEIYALYHCTHA